jgi:hypothetical protein
MRYRTILCLLFLAACGRDASPAAAKTCSYEGKQQVIGQSFLAADGCNQCTCLEGGTVSCTTMACGPAPVAAPTCVAAGKTYQVGEKFAAPDGCNTCECQANGSGGASAACTEMACANRDAAP